MRLWNDAVAAIKESTVGILSRLARPISNAHPTISLPRSGAARDFQHRPRQPIRLAAMDREARKPRHPREHGRQRALDGQCVHREAVAKPHEDVYLKGYKSVGAARTGIGR